MKNHLLKLWGFAFLASAITANAAPPERMDFNTYSSSLTQRSFQGGHQWAKGDVKFGKNGIKKVISETEPITSPVSWWGGLNTPDGEEWTYTINYNIETPDENPYLQNIVSADIVIYDSSFQPVSTLTANFQLGENETSVNSVQLAPTLTKKFFNISDSYEIMVYVHATTVDYIGHSYTQVYSLNDGQLVTTLEGNNIAAIDNARDAWSENYVMAFMRDEISFDDDGMMDYTMHFDIYGKAGWTGGCNLLHTFDVDYTYVSGAGNYALPILMNNHDGKMYYALPRYEKPFFVDAMSEDVTPDNNFIIDLYNSDFELVKTTVIPMTTEEGALFTFPGMGELMGNKDLDFDMFSDGSEPMYIIGYENYITASDDFTTSLYVYDTDGNCLGTVIDNCDNYMRVTDVVGLENQWCFYYSDDVTGGEFRFVDLPSCVERARIPVLMDDNILTDQIDRVPQGGSYKFAASMGYADSDEVGNAYHKIAWFNADGSFDHYDVINLGADIALAMPFISGTALDPYIFNTDDEIEYMFLVKQYADASVSSVTKEYLRIYRNDNELLLNVGPNEETGEYLIKIYLMNIGKATPKLVIGYSGSEGYTLHNLDLPFSKFAGGEGTAENPYLISTAGDMKSIYSYPSSYFKLTADIDFGSNAWSGNECNFTGVLDGDNHTIKNLHLLGSGLISEMSNGAKVKNLTIENAVIEASTTAGVICGSMNGGTSTQPCVENVHIKNVKASGEYDSNFGGIAGWVVVGSSITDCSVTQAYFDFGTQSAIGGIAGSIRTSAAISNCVFDGTLIANVAGGIAGESMTADETIKNCHALVNIKGGEAAGGILGASGRSLISNCFVDGTIRADGVKNAGAGGIVGTLAAHYNKEKNGYVVENCIVKADISASISEPGERNQALARRIVGFTSADEWLVDWESRDPSFDPNDPSTYPYIHGGNEYYIRDNFALDMPLLDSEVGDGASTAEGKSISSDEMTDEFLAGLGYALGDNASSPWMRSLSPLALYHETYSISCPDTDLHLTQSNAEPDGIPATLVFNIDRLYADKVDLKIEAPAVAKLAEVSVSADGYSIECLVYYVGSGATKLIATLGNKQAVVAISTSSASIGCVDAPASAISYDGSAVKAYGEISVYDMRGVCVASGRGNVDTYMLPKGVYVAKANGEILKFKK